MVSRTILGLRKIGGKRLLYQRQQHGVHSNFMAKLADHTETAKSGQKYTFEVYPKYSSWNEVAAAYLVTNRAIKAAGGDSHYSWANIAGCQKRFAVKKREQSKAKLPQFTGSFHPSNYPARNV